MDALNIIIEGEHAEAAERAGVLALQLVKRAIVRIEMDVDKTADAAFKQLSRGRISPDVAVIYSCNTSTLLLAAVTAVKRLRESKAATVHAIFVCKPSAVCLTEYTPPFKAGGRDVGNYAEYFKPDFAAVKPASDRASIEYLPAVNGVTAEGRRYPLTWDNTKQAFQASDLEADGQVICSAVNVYAFTGALKDGTGKRAKRFMLFELAEVVPVSNLHVAVDKMNTHYFEHGTFERRAFNEKNVRPATPSEVLEYLNAKYQYTLKNS